MQRSNIMKLPKAIADRIAAGEVVDRPVSVVKELLENSIDAGANSIVVEIKNGGKSYIRVTDDGCGIPREELYLAFERHATSKIRLESDLFRIHSLGFRGEALASIAAVSNLEIITKTTEETLGSRLKMTGGSVLEEGDTGCPDGTTILVTDLFFNTPARQKFLKNDGAESTLIIDFVSKMALAYPYIRMRMINNGVILFATQGKGILTDNLITLYSKDITERLIHTKEERKDLVLESYISPVDLNRINRKHQVYFINGRNVQSPVMDQAITEAYRERITEGRYPVAYLFLETSPERLDINIHPNKKEVRFDYPDEIKAFLVEALKKALSSEKSFAEIPRQSIIKQNPLFEEPTEKTVNSEQIERVNIKNILSTRRMEETQVAPLENSPDLLYEQPEQPYHVQQTEIQETLTKEFFPAITLHGSIFATYLIGTDEANFYLIDQHAAHERVFYEKLLAEYENTEKHHQAILTPFLIHVSPAVYSRFDEWNRPLLSIGYSMSEFGPKTFIVKEIPAFMKLAEANAFLTDYLDQLDESGMNISQSTLDKIIMNSCKSAIKGNDSIDPIEMEQLLADLSKTKTPFACPHGRPTFIKLSKYDIEKLFKRA